MAVEQRLSDSLPPEFPRWLLRRHSIEDAEAFAQELRAIRIRRMKLQAAAEEAGWGFETIASLGETLEAKLRSTTNPVVREAHKQHYLNTLSRLERQLGLGNAPGAV